MSDAAPDFPSLVREVQEMPTVQAGFILAWTRLRNAIELVTQADGRPDREYLLWLARQMDANSALLGDALIEGTPAQDAHEARAEYVAKLASLEEG